MDAADLVASIDAALLTLDREGKIRSLNPGATETYGYDATELVGRHVDVLIPAAERAAAADLRARALRGERVVPRHVHRIHKNGATVEHALILSAVRDGAGAIVGVAELTHGIATPGAHEEAVYRLAAIVRSSDDAIASKDLNGIVTSWNYAAERMFGYTAEEMIGRSITTIIPTERLAEEDFVLSQVRAGVGVEHFETVRRRRNGTLLDVSLTVSPIRSADGRIIGASKIARDITERKRLAEIQRRVAEQEERARLEALEAENRRIQEASRMKSEFVANMSHELRTPLHSIIGFTEVWIDERLGPVPEEYREIGRIVLTSSRHLLQLIDDVLDLAKLDSGRIEFQPVPIDIRALVDEVYGTVQALADKSGIALGVEVDPAVTGLRLDAAKLKQVCYNYLSNAIKFTREGGRVTLRVVPHGDDAFRIEVEDTGIGIPPEARDRLFVEFHQLDPGTAKRYQGTGLGLALTKRIVEAQGGEVGFDSRPGEGSTFFAILPRSGVPMFADITSRREEPATSARRAGSDG